MNWVLNTLGANGPIILFFLNILCLTQYSHKYVAFYVFFIFIDILLNELLKGVIQQPRPLGYKSNNEVYYNMNYKGIHKFGMPSGHAESTAFSLTYIGLVTKSPLLIILELGIGCIVLYQRWTTRKHTIMQLVVGSIIGCILGIGCYFIVDKTKINT
jgi:membrane-associated phospholipid phosphatase